MGTSADLPHHLLRGRDVALRRGLRDRGRRMPEDDLGNLQPELLAQPRRRIVPELVRIPPVRRSARIRRTRGHKTKKARRWVVERAIGWLNRCRGILIRYEEKAEHCLAVVQLACALIW